jgi:peptide deformylase
VGEESEAAWEGCLSIPGLRGAVRRPARIRFRGVDIAGQAVDGEAAGIVARVMQHENDHLDGVLYPMRMEDFSQFGFTEELARAAAAERAAKEAS